MGFLAIIALVLSMGVPSLSAQNKKAKQSTETIQKVRQEMGKAKTQKDRTMTALDQLATQSGGNLKKAYNKFSNELKKLDKSAKNLRKLATNMRGKSQAYFQNWQKELSKLNNPTLQEQAQARRQEAVEKFEAIEPRIQAAREVFIDFMANLQDIDRYLGSDLSSRGVQTISGMVEETKRQNQQVDQNIAEFLAALDAFTAEFS